MSGTSVNDFFRRQAREARGPESPVPANRKKKRSKVLRRIALASAISLVVAGGAIAGGGYLMVNRVASSVQRLQGIAALDAAHQPVMPAASRKSITVLLTSSRNRPTQVGGSGKLGSSTSPQPLSGLIALVHLNADNRAGAVVSIPATVVVNVPGHGRMRLWSTLNVGGPSLLITTVEHLTNVRISHYSVLDFAGAVQVVAALNGVNVDVPRAFTNGGFTFRAGINHLTAASVLAYVRHPGISQVVRTELQQNLIRAMLDKIGEKRLLGHVGSDLRVLHALAAALSVDSNFSNSELISLGLRLGHLRGRDGTFITAPTVRGAGDIRLNRPVTRKLWSAIRHDSVAAFARRYPFMVTPGAPG